MPLILLFLLLFLLPQVAEGACSINNVVHVAQGGGAIVSNNYDPPACAETGPSKLIFVLHDFANPNTDNAPTANGVSMTEDLFHDGGTLTNDPATRFWRIDSFSFTDVDFSLSLDDVAPEIAWGTIATLCLAAAGADSDSAVTGAGTLASTSITLTVDTTTGDCVISAFTASNDSTDSADSYIGTDPGGYMAEDGSPGYYDPSGDTGEAQIEFGVATANTTVSLGWNSELLSTERSAGAVVYNDAAAFTPTNTNTPLPTSTNTPVPTATNTPPPTATNTLGPSPTPPPTATNTPPPTATNTPVPTNTPAPTDTFTPTPTVPPAGGRLPGASVYVSPTVVIDKTNPVVVATITIPDLFPGRPSRVFIHYDFWATHEESSNRNLACNLRRYGQNAAVFTPIVRSSCLSSSVDAEISVTGNCYWPWVHYSDTPDDSFEFGGDGMFPVNDPGDDFPDGATEATFELYCETDDPDNIIILHDINISAYSDVPVDGLGNLGIGVSHVKRFTATPGEATPRPGFENFDIPVSSASAGDGGEGWVPVNGIYVDMELPPSASGFFKARANLMSSGGGMMRGAELRVVYCLTSNVIHTSEPPPASVTATPGSWIWGPTCGEANLFAVGHVGTDQLFPVDTLDAESVGAMGYWVSLASTITGPLMHRFELQKRTRDNTGEVKAVGQALLEVVPVKDYVGGGTYPWDVNCQGPGVPTPTPSPTPNNGINLFVSPLWNTLALTTYGSNPELSLPSAAAQGHVLIIGSARLEPAGALQGRAFATSLFFRGLADADLVNNKVPGWLIGPDTWPYPMDYESTVLTRMPYVTEDPPHVVAMRGQYLTTGPARNVIANNSCVLGFSLVPIQDTVPTATPTPSLTFTPSSTPTRTPTDTPTATHTKIRIPDLNLDTKLGLGLDSNSSRTLDSVFWTAVEHLMITQDGICNYQAGGYSVELARRQEGPLVDCEDFEDGNVEAGIDVFSDIVLLTVGPNELTGEHKQGVCHNPGEADDGDPCRVQDTLGPFYNPSELLEPDTNMRCTEPAGELGDGCDLDTLNCTGDPNPTDPELSWCQPNIYNSTEKNVVGCLGYCQERPRVPTVLQNLRRAIQGVQARGAVPIVVIEPLPPAAHHNFREQGWLRTSILKVAKGLDIPWIDMQESIERFYEGNWQLCWDGDQLSDSCKARQIQTYRACVEEKQTYVEPEWKDQKILDCSPEQGYPRPVNAMGTPIWTPWPTRTMTFTPTFIGPTPTRTFTPPGPTPPPSLGPKDGACDAATSVTDSWRRQLSRLGEICLNDCTGIAEGEGSPEEGNQCGGATFHDGICDVTHAENFEGGFVPDGIDMLSQPPEAIPNVRIEGYQPADNFMDRVTDHAEKDKIRNACSVGDSSHPVPLDLPFDFYDWAWEHICQAGGDCTPCDVHRWKHMDGGNDPDAYGIYECYERIYIVPQMNRILAAFKALDPPGPLGVGELTPRCAGAVYNRMAYSLVGDPGYMSGVWNSCYSEACELDEDDCGAGKSQACDSFYDVSPGVTTCDLGWFESTIQNNCTHGTTPHPGSNPVNVPANPAADTSEFPFFTFKAICEHEMVVNKPVKDGWSRAHGWTPQPSIPATMTPTPPPP